MQGFNMGRYRPPAALDEALSTSPTSNNTQKAHPLGARARKLPAGILVVRFEMPFAIWCSTCPSHSNNQLIGQGVRFNAEKKRVGNYFSTPIWSFRMKHTACGGWIEIRTDPKNSEYVVTEGAKRRDTGEDEAVAERDGGMVLRSEEEKKRQDAFEAFEGKKIEKERTKTEAQRLEELRSVRERDWKDPDAANRKLRAGFRDGRKTREADAAKMERLQDRTGFGFDLLAESDDDRKRAALMDFGVETGGLETDSAALKASSRPLFQKANLKSGGTSRRGSSRSAELHETLSNNTRAVINPFGGSTSRTPNSHVIPGLKRKRKDEQDVVGKVAGEPTKEAFGKVEPETSEANPRSSGLVGYGSDSEG